MKAFLLFAVALITSFLLATFLTNPSAQDIRDEYAPNQLVVKFRSDLSADRKNTILSRFNPTDIRHLKWATRAAVLTFSSDRDLDGILSNLSDVPDLLIAARNARVYLSTTPNDTCFSSQWHLDDGDDVDIDAPAAWDRSTGSSSVTVAVIDTGVEDDHEDLADNLLTGYNVIDLSSDVEDTSPHSHGTAVTGIIAAIGNNGKGVAGVTWNTKILPIKWLHYTCNPGCTSTGGALMGMLPMLSRTPWITERTSST